MAPNILRVGVNDKPNLFFFITYGKNFEIRVLSPKNLTTKKM